MAARHVVVDGSNLATEGRSMPSLAQLDAAVREFLLENPDDMVIVVVDASFGHRIDPSEVKVFDEAEAAGELVSPPAGAIGRGDAFLLRIADKTGATVLSNDSFQEFHGDYEWLFDRGRLIGGKPVPGVGWIFTPRTPVRGPRSREAVKEAKRKTKGDGDEAPASAPAPAMPGLDLAAERAKTEKGKGRKNLERAIAVALEEAVAPKQKARRARKGISPPAEPVNDPLTFIRFIAAHPLGGEVTGVVDSFASHGAFVECEGARCYVPLSAMGDPPPKSAREVFAKGESVRLVIQALDPLRRGVELAVPGFAKIAGAPTDETVAAEISARVAEEVAPPAPVKRAGRKAAAAPAPVAPAEAPVATSAPAKRTRKKAAAAGVAAVPPDLQSVGTPPGDGSRDLDGSAQPEPATAAPAPRRRRTAKAAFPAPVDGEPPAPSLEGATAPAGAAAAPRRRSPAKRASRDEHPPDESLAPAPVPGVELAVSPPAAVAAPSPPTTAARKRRPAKKTAPPPADVVPEPAVAPPRRRRGTSGTAAGDPTPATSDEAPPEPLAAPKPPRRRSAARRAGAPETPVEG